MVSIQVEDLGKKYFITRQQESKHNTLRDLLAFRAKRLFEKRAETADVEDTTSTIQEFWALRNIDLEVQQGEQLAIIGYNGAGKSTLLKLLSRITEPTEGRINIKGRVASLLEVGTGFSGELTGRENIFLNAAILGMKRKEVLHRFDSIVEFAEVSQFLDTPLKRYSTGMYLRLAFAVAAHLDPEIMMIDEVLAVGDVKFQQKCIQKIEDISRNEGRTILFVSHSLGIVHQLCNKAVLLEKGRLVLSGSTKEVIDHYLGKAQQSSEYVSGNKAKYDVFIHRASVLDNQGNIQSKMDYGEPISLEVAIHFNRYVPNLKLAVMLQSQAGEYLTTMVFEVPDARSFNVNGEKVIKCKIEGGTVAPNQYAFCLALFITPELVHDWVEMVCPLSIIDTGTPMTAYAGINFGSYFFVPHQFTLA
jgi:lipopolysaccharide transport system ATP-binding protein